jgi:50S ribosomal subunit-associated GTPase HflX
VEAALILHVIDVSAADAAKHTEHVMRVLAEIGATTSPQLLVARDRKGGWCGRRVG